MSSSSNVPFKKDEILLKLDFVKNKKGCDGILYVLIDRILWTPLKIDSNDFANTTAQICANFDDVKVQKISPEGKAKIQLQLCLNDGQSHTFHFCNGAGQAKQLEDRESVKNLVQQRLMSSKVKLNSELETKQRILQENKQLFVLYKELVTTNIIPPDEFWKIYAKDQINEKMQNSTAQEVKNSQKVGVSSGFLSDVTKIDGCNGIKFTLTTDIIESIFRTYPSVKKKHSDMVITKQMTEEDFWTKFFQSQYFHRDRHGHHHKKEMGVQDFFADCLKIDNEDLQTQAGVLRHNKRTIEEFDDDRGLAVNLDLDDDVRSKVRNPANVELIRKFNYRSGSVLRACLGEEGQSLAENGEKSSSMATLGSLLPSTSYDLPNSRFGAAKRPKRNQFNESKDDVNNSTTGTSSSSTFLPLNLHKVEKYQTSGCCSTTSGSTKSTSNSGGGTLKSPPHETSSSRVHKLEMVQRWRQRANKCARNNRWNVNDFQEVISSDAAYDVLLDMSARSSDDYANLHEKIPPNLLDEMRSMYLALNELLRHFWSCFPVTTPETEQKLVKIYETLTKFEENRLNKQCSAERWNGALSFLPFGSSTAVLGHSKIMLQAAYSKYENWQQRKC